MADAKMKMEKTARSPPREGRAVLEKLPPEQATHESTKLKGILKQRDADTTVSRQHPQQKGAEHT